MKRFIILTTILISMLAACSNTSDPIPEKKNEAEVQAKQENKDEKVKKGEKAEIVEPKVERENKFSFNKDIQVVHVRELNTNALKERPLGGIAVQNSLYVDDMLYFFYDVEELPTQKTEMIVIQDNFNHDYLLGHELIQTTLYNATLSFPARENEYVNDNNRLFLNNKLKIEKQHNNDSIIVTFKGTSYEVKANDVLEIPLKKGETESTLIISNHGMLNTIENMRFEMIENEELLYSEDEEGNKIRCCNKFQGDKYDEEEDLTIENY